MRSSLSASATLRIAGDNVVPDKVTELLQIPATKVRIKGEAISSRHANVVPTTNVWLFDTSKTLVGADLDQHIRLILVLLQGEHIQGGAPTMGIPWSRFAALKRFLRNNAAQATLSLFWHGGPREREPKIRGEVRDFLELMDIQLECDFATEEARPPRKPRLA